ncbi:MAG: DnaJ C-terminal domain-containing protein [Myxococcota bacterium]
MSSPDHYAALGVEPNATQDEVRAAWRRIARVDHPDLRPDDDEAATRFRRAQAAHAILSDPEARASYDRERNSASPPPVRRVGGLWRRLQATQGADLRLRLPLGLVEQARGTVRTVGVERSEECDLCGGGGCSACARSGRRPVRRRVEVRVPAGVRPGSRLRIEGEGDGGRSGGPNGDLVVVVEGLTEDEGLSRVGDDLEVEVPVRLSEVLLGARVSIPTLEGVEEVDLPPGFDPTRARRLEGRGMPKRSGGRGDLILLWRLDLPSPPSSALQDWGREFAKMESDSPERQRYDARLSRWRDVDG